MSYITKEKNTMNKGEKNLITINKAMFAFASTFADAYFADSLNWKKIAIHFKHETSNQRKIITLMSEADSAPFEMSEMARTGNWQVEKIQVFDKDGDMVEVPRSDMPSPSSFDFTTVRKIAPSETIVAINEGPQKLVLGSGKGALYEPGFKVRLWNNTLLNFHDSNVYTINSINGDELELDMAVANYNDTGNVVVQNITHLNPPSSSINDGMFMFGNAYPVEGLNENQSYTVSLQMIAPSLNGVQQTNINWYIRAEDAFGQNIVTFIGSGDTFNSSYNTSTFNDVFSILPGQLNGVASVVFGIMNGDINHGSFPIEFDLTISTQGPSGLKPLSLKFPSFSDASPKQKGIYQFIGSTF